MYELMNAMRTEDCFNVFIDNYEDISLQPHIFEYYRLIIRNVLSKLFNNLCTEKKRLRRLSKSERLFLSCLLNQYISQATKRELARKIESLQLSPIKLFIKKKINLLRAILNYGLTSGLNVANDIIRSHLSYLPPITESQVRDILPSIDLEAETEFNSVENTYSTLIRICAIIKQLGYSHISVCLDKFDEDNRMKNNAETVSSFIAPLLTDNKILETPELQLVIAVWEIPFNRIRDIVRTQKHFCPLLSWPEYNLRNVLNKRLSIFSDHSLTDFNNLFDDDVNSESINEILYLSNGNPRDLWHIFNCIFQSQYSMNPNAKMISSAAIKMGLDDFVTHFNFYEYYPKKPNAKANSMDIYGYIKHLLKLPNTRFTKNQLREYANTGSSTNNYVVGMENIGLVVKTSEKTNHGGVIYQIVDPKVVYAFMNKLDISK